MTKRGHILFLLLLGTLSFQVTAQNFVRNPGFEAGTANWLSFSSFSFGTTTSGPHSGNACVQASLGGLGGVMQSFATNPPPTQRMYLLSGWVRTSSGTGAVNLYFKYND